MHNFNDKRVQKRLLLIEEQLFEKSCKSKDESTALHNITIKNIFGNRANNLSDFLKKHILILDNDPSKNYIVGERSRSYYINWNNLAYFFQEANLITNTNFKISSLTANSAITLFEMRALERSERLHNGIVTYNEPELGNRLFAPFQNISKQVRMEFFSQWHDYDIEAAAYCLVHQHYLTEVLPWWNSSPELRKSKTDRLITIQQVYQEKSRIRNHLAKELGVSTDMVKEMLQIILFNANFFLNQKSSFYDTLQKNGYDPYAFYATAKKSALLQQLIAEVRLLWPPVMTYWNFTHDKRGRKKFVSETIDKSTGEIKTRFKSGKFRANIYFELERRVLDVANEYLTNIENQHHSNIRLIHDGFFCKNKIDKSELEHYVLMCTGYDVTYSYAQFL